MRINKNSLLYRQIRYHDIDLFSFRLDDIQDNSVLRRGIPVAHSIYGVASTINASNYASLLALEKSKDLEHPDVRNKTFYYILIALQL